MNTNIFAAFTRNLLHLCLGVIGRKITAILTVVVYPTCLWFSCTEPASAQSGITYSHTLASKYVSRGVNTVNNLVLHSNADFEVGRTTVSIWGNIELSNHNGHQYVRTKPAGTVTEWNITVEHVLAEGKTSLRTGWIDYQYPGTGWQRTMEIYLALGFDVPLSPVITVYRDIGTVKGTYVSAQIELPVRETAAVVAQVGYGCTQFNSYYYSYGKGSWTDLAIGFNFNVDVGRGWQVKPGVWYSTLLNRALLADVPNRQNWWLSFVISR